MRIMYNFIGIKTFDFIYVERLLCVITNFSTSNLSNQVISAFMCCNTLVAINML